ncbi:MAG TPA: hypothetical protein VK206_00215 [Anaerolineales bacterium]|nr:hypothetical protein [Anaerolineales bacterium]HLO28705.1 hypothetical protein [Anaerolineales bacterium]
MKTLFRALIVPAVCFALIACTQSTEIPLSPVPSLTGTLTPTITPSQTAAPTVATTPTPTYIIPTRLPTIDPESVPGLLSKAFSLQRFTGLSGYNVQQITGWEYGFGGVSGPYPRYSGYYWLDASHLLLYPRLGEQVNGFSGFWEDLAYQPAVINLENGYVWLPDKGNVYWSSELGLLIEARLKTSSAGDQREAVDIYTLDGQRTALYWGKLTGVSPSRTKILMGNRWIDLKSGKTVAFEWDKDFDKDIDIYFPRPLWSSDETQVYTCCYKYGNAGTGESFTFLPDEVSLDGQKIDDILYHAYGQWVLNDSQLLIQFDWFNSIPLDFIPLFDIKARTLHNLNTLTGIPTYDDGIPNCPMAFASPDGKSIWAKCYSGGYLVDLTTFTSVEFPMSNSYDYPTWSANSQFAWMETEPRQLLSVSSKTLSPLPVNPLLNSEPLWHPTDNILAYLSEEGRKLELLNAQTMSPREVELPTVFQSLAWSPGADSIALLAKDGSLWRLDYPRLKNLEQLALSSPEGRDINWSPDGNSIAFISGSDIYIVDVTK